MRVGSVVYMDPRVGDIVFHHQWEDALFEIVAVEERPDPFLYSDHGSRHYWIAKVKLLGGTIHPPPWFSTSDFHLGDLRLAASLYNEMEILAMCASDIDPR